MSAIQRNIAAVKAVLKCQAYALIIAMLRVNVDPNDALYRRGYGLKKPVEELLEPSGVDLTNGGGFEKIQQFQEHLSYYKIKVFDGLNPDRVMFSGDSFRPKNDIYYIIGAMGTIK